VQISFCPVVSVDDLSDSNSYALCWYQNTTWYICIIHADDAILLIFQEATKKQLLDHGIQLEDFGGDAQAVPISALKVRQM
jgi:hypothetical protein